MMQKWAPRIAVFLVLGALVNVGVAWSCAFFNDTSDEISNSYQAQNTWHVKRQDYRGTVHSFSSFGSQSWSLSLNAYNSEHEWIATDGSDIFSWWSRLRIPNKFTPVKYISMHEQAQGWPFLTAHCDWMTTSIDVSSPRYSMSRVYVRRDNLHSGLDLRVLFEPEPEPEPGLDTDPETFQDISLYKEPDARRGWFLNPFFEESTILPFHPIWSGLIINTLFYAVLIWGVVSGPGVARRAFRKYRNRCPACAYPIGTSAICTECGYHLLRIST